MRLPELAQELTRALGVQHKRDIQAAAHTFSGFVGGSWGHANVRVGDDCAAIPDGDGYLLLACEGMWPELVAREPQFASYCAVMTNVSDVYAMGGRPIALVNALFATSGEAAAPLWQGLSEGAKRFGVPVVGGHTNLHSPHQGLAAAILGRAQRLLTSFDARPGDDLIAAVDLRGDMHPLHPFWNASTDAPSERLRADYEILPTLAESEWLLAAKDISMGGLVGTTLMLLETSGVGATLQLEHIPRPQGIAWSRWLLAFPSYGFLLSVPPKNSAKVTDAFKARGIAAARIGKVNDGHCLVLTHAGDHALVWDLSDVPLTGFGART